MRIELFFFSGTGNTWWVSERLAEQLRAGGAEVAVHSIEQISVIEANDLIQEADLVVFGYPIYGSDLPSPMKRFIGELSATVQGKPTAVFCTQWLWSGDGARVGAEMLVGKGFNVRWAEHFLMPNNISLPMFPMAIHTNDDARKVKYLRFSQNRVKRLVEIILKGKPFRRGFSKVAEASGILQRGPYRRYMENKWGDSLSVGHELCNKCGLCVRLCPEGNFSLESGKVVPHGKCTMCVRCYNFCPQKAILYKGKKHRHGTPYRGPVPDFDPAVLT